MVEHEGISEQNLIDNFHNSYPFVFDEVKDNNLFYSCPIVYFYSYLLYVRYLNF